MQTALFLVNLPNRNTTVAKTVSCKVVAKLNISEKSFRSPKIPPAWTHNKLYGINPEIWIFTGVINSVVTNESRINGLHFGKI